MRIDIGVGTGIGLGIGVGIGGGRGIGLDIGIGRGCGRGGGIGVGIGSGNGIGIGIGMGFGIGLGIGIGMTKTVAVFNSSWRGRRRAGECLGEALEGVAFAVHGALALACGAGGQRSSGDAIDWRVWRSLVGVLVVVDARVGAQAQPAISRDPLWCLVAQTEARAAER